MKTCTIFSNQNRTPELKPRNKNKNFSVFTKDLQYVAYSFKCSSDWPYSAGFPIKRTGLKSFSIICATQQKTPRGIGKNSKKKLTLGGRIPPLKSIRPLASFVRNLNEIFPDFLAFHGGRICNKSIR